MNYRFVILLLWIALFAMSPAEAFQACDNGNIQNTSVYQTDDAHCDAGEDACIEAHPGQDCPPDTDGCGHCHCPGCGTSGGMTYAGFFKNTFTELPALYGFYDRRAANFCYGAPSTSAHLIALFQPPRV